MLGVLVCLSGCVPMCLSVRVEEQQTPRKNLQQCQRWQNISGSSGRGNRAVPITTAVEQL